MPGRIVQSTRTVARTNAFVLLDEIDKLGSDCRGDPSSALLEVLDPAQNTTFGDHYLEVDQDLSEGDVRDHGEQAEHASGPLLDRMEVIRVTGYTEDEKVDIAQRYLLPKQLKANGLKEGRAQIVPEETIRDLIRYYTREAGVRTLERALAKIWPQGGARDGQDQGCLHPRPPRCRSPPSLAEYAGVQKLRLRARRMQRTRWAWSQGWPGPSSAATC